MKQPSRLILLLLSFLGTFSSLTSQAHAGPAFITVGLGYAQPGWKYTLETSADLIHWAAAPEGTPFMGDGLPHAVTCATQSANRMFFRWRVTDPSPYATAPPSFGALGSPTFPTALMDVGDPALDSDGDGFSDVIERLLKTDPNDPSDNPTSKGLQSIALERINEEYWDGISAQWIGNEDSSKSHWLFIELLNLNPADNDYNYSESAHVNYTSSATPVWPGLPSLPALHAVPSAVLPDNNADWSNPPPDHDNPSYVALWLGGNQIASSWSSTYAGSSSVGGNGPGNGWSTQRSYLRLRTNVPMLRDITQNYLTQTTSYNMNPVGGPFSDQSTVDGSGGYDIPVVEATSNLVFTIPAGQTTSAVLVSQVAPVSGKAKTVTANFVSIVQPREKSPLDYGPEVLDEATELRIGRWRNAFVQDGNGNWSMRADNFIPSDHDRIQFQVVLPSTFGESTTVQVTTVDAQGATVQAARTITLVRERDLNNGSSIYWAYLYLVTDDADDHYAGSAGSWDNGQLTDQTHLVTLGGKLRITASWLPQPIERPIMKKKLTKKINWVWLDKTGSTPLPYYLIDGGMKVIKETFAQIGVQVDLADTNGKQVFSNFSALPQDVKDALDDEKFRPVFSLDIDDEGAIPAEEHLYQYFSNFSGDIEIICVPAKIFRRYNRTDPSSVFEVAAWTHKSGSKPIIVMNSKYFERFSNNEVHILEAHELGHALGLPHRDREATQSEYLSEQVLTPSLPQHFLMCPIMLYSEAAIDTVKRYQLTKRFRQEDEAVIFSKK